jgi:response regulator RpfG family c-di-GMP phosphodiesterase
MVTSPSRNSEKILIVDDEVAIRLMLQSGIEMAGYRCFTAADSSAALNILAQHAIDVVVADIHMPEMSGIELARIIKDRYTADVIVMTGYVDVFAYEDIVQEGASDFIQKPLRIAEFIARLKRVLVERAGKSDRVRVMEELRINLDKFQRAMEGIVQAISVAVEMRDPYTAGHQQRVAEVACAIAERMNFSADDIYGLRMASVIHDLGKITVPAGILSKPGKLSQLEYELIKSHVQAGYDILKNIEFPWPLAQIILQHHERLDGSGYPQGLKGEQILPQARILAVADVLETIASHRPYRPSLGLDRAINEIRSHLGTLYDAGAARVCLAMIEAGEINLGS